jgi:hypothetical protein
MRRRAKMAAAPYVRVVIGLGAAAKQPPEQLGNKMHCGKVKIN